MFFVPSVKSSNVSLFLISMILKLLINSFNRGVLSYYLLIISTHACTMALTLLIEGVSCVHTYHRHVWMNSIISFFFLKIITDINMSMSCLVYWFVLHCCILFTHVILEIVNFKFNAFFIHIQSTFSFILIYNSISLVCFYLYIRSRLRVTVLVCHIFKYIITCFD
jgi:hypothetical protein